jgi:hypothetical protein
MKLPNFLSLNYIRLLRKKNKDNLIELDTSDLIPDKEDVLIFLPEERLISKFDPSKPSLLIIDDSKGIISIVEDYIELCTINKEHYNILTFFGKYAPFVMEETLLTLREKGLQKIDYAIIDLVLPGKIKNGDVCIKKDGVDVAEFLHSEFSCTNMCFYTGNALKIYPELTKEKADRFEKYFNKSFFDYVIFKGADMDIDIVNEFCKLIYNEKYEL